MDTTDYLSLTKLLLPPLFFMLGDYGDALEISLRELVRIDDVSSEIS